MDRKPTQKRCSPSCGGWRRAPSPPCPTCRERGSDNRLYDGVRAAVSLDELLSLVKTKRYPLSRIRRLVWNAYLGVDADLMTLPPPTRGPLLQQARHGDPLRRQQDHPYPRIPFAA